ncbi:hypothetical protein [Modestobacter versicolor]|uniref:hypothetical protein n=1 Tax=Modestobacter versicolor TaxID=429133 RepID=UPI0034DE5262
MRLHVLYRSSGGENAKPRPPFHDKRVSLASFLRAVSTVPDVDLTFVNNGPQPADRLELMQATGAPVLQIVAPGGRASLRWALQHAMAADWADDDMVYLVEDDYLHTPDALARLDAAMRALPEVAYLMTYGSTPGLPVGTAEHYAEITPDDWRPGVPATVDGRTWRPALAPTSTFAVRVGALREDYRLFLQAHLPYRSHYLDLQLGLVWQGYEPYRWSDVAREAVGLRGGGLKGRLVGISEAPFKAAFNLRSHRRPSRRRLVYVAEPNLATHVEVDLLAQGEDWEFIARDAQKWLDEGAPGLDRAAVRVAP